MISLTPTITRLPQEPAKQHHFLFNFEGNYAAWAPSMNENMRHNFGEMVVAVLQDTPLEIIVENMRYEMYQDFGEQWKEFFEELYTIVKTGLMNANKQVVTNMIDAIVNVDIFFEHHVEMLDPFTLHLILTEHRL
jgi:hypothetical protein